MFNYQHFFQYFHMYSHLFIYFLIYFSVNLLYFSPPYSFIAVLFSIFIYWMICWYLSHLTNEIFVKMSYEFWDCCNNGDILLWQPWLSFRGPVTCTVIKRPNPHDKHKLISVKPARIFLFFPLKHHRFTHNYNGSQSRQQELAE